ncbi:SusC/RagA family TonB-linked outer membrane protein [Flavisericum labens]|uniref:SusC/RagA family TonB-linked outer membrane protein n=1 Tax=Flavisericum labens TaxID=3377112 RepID=UPI00387AA307
MQIKLINALHASTKIGASKRLLLLIMRTFIFLLCTTVFSFNAETTLAQEKVTIDVDKEATIDEVFEIIIDQTQYRFLYPEDLFKNAPKVHLSKGTIRVDKLLNQSISLEKFNIVISTDNIISFKEKNTTQEFQISGKITDENGLPLIGITVYITNVAPVEGNMSKEFIIRGTTTDLDGNFNLKTEKGYYLIVTGLGYEFYSQQLIEDKTVYNIILKEKVSQLDEVLVVGYGTTKKKDLTGSIGSVTSKEIEQIKGQSVDQLLVGKMPGVYVQGQGGRPGSGAIVNIRGLSAIRGDNQPLYVVDGTPIIVNPAGLSNNGENPLLAINPADIERVDVLKDASAAAIYGSRAANGVILITTKRGTRNSKPQLNISFNSTIQSPINTYDVFNATEYKNFTLKNAEKRVNDGNNTPLDSQIVNDPNSFFRNENTDWQKESTNNIALWNEYRINFTGGSDKINYLVSSNITDQESLFLGGKFNRYGLATNIDANVTDSFIIGTSLNYNYSVNKSSDLGSFEQVSIFRPDVGIYDEFNEYTTAPLYPGAPINTRNPVGGAAESRNKTLAQFMYATIYGEYKIVNGLKFKSQINVATNSSETENFDPSFSSSAAFRLLNGGTQEASLNYQHSRSYTTVFSNTLSYNKTFGNHNIDAVIGVSWDKYRQDLKSQTYLGFPDDYILTDIASANRVESYGSQSIENGLNSQFGRLNYKYKDTWLATFTARRDGSTKFGPNNQYGFFPSGAIAWNLHNEKFFKNNVVNKLKLRTSLGKTGSDNLASFSYLANFNSGYFYNNINGTAVNGIPNYDIQWEETDQLDIGSEFSLFNNRIYGEVVYFTKNTSGIILFTPLPIESGFTSFNANVADVSNKGWEIGFGADIIRTNNFKWNSEMNISFIKNNVDNLYNGSVSATGNLRALQEGQPIGVITGYDVLSIAQSQEEIDALNAAAPDGTYWSSLQEPGDYILKDIDGDGEITPEDITPLGSILPEYFGGWNNNFTYKNFDLGVNFTFVQGNKREISSVMARFLADSDPYANTTSVVYDTWSPENTNATYGRIGSPTTVGAVALSKFVEDASYIRLKTLSFGYNVPKIFLDKLNISRARISFLANNLLTFSNYSGLDPESVQTLNSGSGTFGLAYDNGSYPLSKTYSLSINLSF